MDSYLYRWFTAWVLTLALETPVVVRLLRGHASTRQAAELSVLATTLTHPLLWFAWRPLVEDYTTYVVSGELLVFLAETAVYRQVTTWRHAALVSLAANAFSWGFGWLLLYGMVRS